MRKKIGDLAVIVSLVASCMTITWIAYNWRKELKAIEKHEETPIETG